MLQFVFADGAGTTQVALCSIFPFNIGRDPSAHLQLSAPGVWDQHARVLREKSSGKLVIESVGQAMLLINGARVERAFLLPGQQVQIGGATFGVSLAPVAQKNLRLAEGLLWTLVLLIVLLEAVLLIVLR
jgi:hypothetical protein